MSITTHPIRFNPPQRLYYLIFILSGFSGLIYESVWSHYLKLLLGHAAYAQSLVLSIFMGGMAIGAWLAGHYSSRWKTPILAYAILEGVIGIMGLLFHNSFIGISHFVYMTLLPATDSIALAHLLKWSVAASLMLPQSILLGMTFPLMTAGVIRRYPENAGHKIATLYFTNSLGAAVGVLTSGFWLIKTFGLPGTIMTAGLINLLLALCVWSIVRADTHPASRSLAPADTPHTQKHHLLLAAAFITGMASFIYEIGWIRMLGLVLGSSTHAFELMLSAFITGLAFGGLWIRKRIDSFKSPLMFAGYIQILMGLLALSTLWIYSSTFEWINYILHALHRSPQGYTVFLLSSHGIALLVMLPATFCAGMTLPLFTHMLLKTGHGEKSIGRIYAANTAGAIAGVLFAINIGLPVFGIKSLISMGAALDIVLGIILLVPAVIIARRYKTFAAVSTLTLVAFILVLSQSNINSAQLASGVFRYGRTHIPENQSIYYYKDGKTASVSLYGEKDRFLAIATNGKPDATIYYRDADYTMDEITMVLSGALPFGFKPDAAQIANIGMGSGLTTHTLLALPQIKQVDTIEIEAAMVEASKGFGEKVSRTHTDPRSKIHIEDAKTFFSTRKKQYDIIVSEPSNPWVSGVANLFTAEFYQQINRYLVDDGLLVQWLHLYESDQTLIASVLKALSTSFADYAIYNTNEIDILIIARKTGALGKLSTDFLLNSALQTGLKQVGIKTAIDLQYRLLITRHDLNPILEKIAAPINSDFFPYLDLHSHRAFFLGSRATEMLLHETPLPTIDMLQNDALYQMQETLTSSELFGPSITTEAARSALALLYKPESPASSRLNLPTQNLITNLQSTAAQCGAKPFMDTWLANLHNLAQLLIRNLSIHEASQAFNSPAFLTCTKTAAPPLQTWLAFYTSVAQRNHEKMGSLAKQLLHETPKDQLQLKTYLLTAGIIGYLRAGYPDAAASLWKEHSNLYPNLASVPMYLKIAAFAAYK